MPEQRNYRRAEPDDLPAVTALLEQAQLPLAGVAAHFGHFLLAVREDVLLGCAALEPYGPAALLRSVAVRAEAQGQGIGQALVLQILQQAEAAGLRQIFLLTTTAAEFFQRFGFQAITRDEVPAEVKTSVEFQGVCPLSAVVMRLDLAEAGNVDEKTSLLPPAQRRSYAAFYRAARNNEILDDKTTMLVHIATALAVGCIP